MELVPFPALVEKPFYYFEIHGNRSKNTTVVMTKELYFSSNHHEMAPHLQSQVLGYYWRSVKNFKSVKECKLHQIKLCSAVHRQIWTRSEGKKMERAT
jgi:hypothetical protein